jgi:NAD(P)-dependent dehydrogenase (short-subunit alcohol dehydrogenase family)
MGRLDGKVAVISGAARGQGRAHAVTMAREGADIVAFDICAPLRHPLHPGATEEDLQQTAKLVEQHDRRCLSANPAAINTPMVFEGGTLEKALEYRPDYIGHNRAVLPMPNGWVDAQRVADAAIWLVSDEASWVTGAMIPVDGGWSAS